MTSQQGVPLIDVLGNMYRAGMVKSVPILTHKHLDVVVPHDAIANAQFNPLYKPTDVERQCAAAMQTLVPGGEDFDLDKLDPEQRGWWMYFYAALGGDRPSAHWVKKFAEPVTYTN